MRSSLLGLPLEKVSRFGLRVGPRGPFHVNIQGIPLHCGPTATGGDGRASGQEVTPEDRSVDWLVAEGTIGLLDSE